MSFGKGMNSLTPDLVAFANAARAVGADIAKTKEELERLITMIVKDKIVVKIPKKIKKKILDGEGKEIEIEEERIIEETRDATVEDMISATLVLILQDEKFRKHVPSRMLNQLTLAASAVRNYENRKLDGILPAIKSRIRSDLLIILHKAYPAWQSLVPDATPNMLNAMSAQHQRKEENTMSRMYQSQHGIGPPT